MLFEKSGGTLQFEPEAAGGRLGEFISSWGGQSLFVEVKTVFDDPYMQQWDEVSSSIFKAFSGLKGPYAVDADLIEPPKSGSMNQQRLRSFLSTKIKENTLLEDQLEPEEQPDHRDFIFCDPSGCVLRLTLVHEPGTEYITRASTISGPFTSLSRVRKTLRDAQRPRDGSMCGVVVLCLQGIQIGVEQLEPILFGGRNIYPNHVERKGDGIWGNEGKPHAQWMSAVGVYKQQNEDYQMSVYHCPWAHVRMPPGALAGGAVTHFTLDEKGVDITQIS